MKRLKYFLMILCMSFTLVVMLNVLLISMKFNNLMINAENIQIIFMVCLIIALGTVLLDMVPVIKDYPVIHSYVLVMLVANGVPYLLTHEFYWNQFFIQAIFLTIVYLGVWFLLYLDDEKKIKKINQRIQEMNK